MIELAQYAPLVVLVIIGAMIIEAIRARFTASHGNWTGLLAFLISFSILCVIVTFAMVEFYV